MRTRTPREWLRCGKQIAGSAKSTYGPKAGSLLHLVRLVRLAVRTVLPGLNSLQVIMPSAATCSMTRQYETVLLRLCVSLWFFTFLYDSSWSFYVFLVGQSGAKLTGQAISYLKSKARFLCCSQFYHGCDEEVDSWSSSRSGRQMTCLGITCIHESYMGELWRDRELYRGEPSLSLSRLLRNRSASTR